MDRNEGTPQFTYYSLACRPLLTHYNGSLRKALDCPYYSFAGRPLVMHYNGPL
jgi:hypothetical protein